LFKGAVTSDGLPDCEMAACMHAGAHPHLVSAIGQVTQHPQHTQALVMPLIAPEFGNLASPPSLDSCTRDVYPTDTHIDWRAALRMAQGIASAVLHLHRRGIVHGDLYAHNILHTAEGHALLSDFGAAAFFDVTDTRRAQGLEKLEVRALGCLLEELAWHCKAQAAHTTHRQALVQLAQQCLREVPAERPSLTQVSAMLEALAA
jgi:serine/threonine protein kinase